MRSCRTFKARCRASLAASSWTNAESSISASTGPSASIVALKTLPVGLLIEKPQAEKSADQPATLDTADNDQNKIFKHGVQITVRGGYLDLLSYVSALEKMPSQMFWGEASLSVEQYPDSVLTLTLYTLSLGKLWLTV